MIRIGITGGIGSGKSFVCRHIEALGYPVFQCDDEAKRIIRTDPTVAAELKALVSPDLYKDGMLQKSILAAYLCQGEEYAENVNAIVHPHVATAFRNYWQQIALQKQMQPSAPALVFMECALLFESGFNRLVDKTLLVTAPEETRLQRVMNRDHISRGQALKWMALQMPESEKARLSHFQLINDGRHDIQSQLTTLISHWTHAQA